jgi:CRISPR/Cas system-associated exonuclease Cas4 (RecB family)
VYWVPERFELAFGLRDRTQSDPASLKDPVDLGWAKVHGSIDLTERGTNGAVRVTDHKTGKVRAERVLVIGGGKVLQPVLYSLAAEKILRENVVEGRLYYCTAAGDYEERTVVIDEKSRAAARDIAAILTDALDAGFLPAAPDRLGRNQSECDYCDYRRVCGPYEIRRVSHKPQVRLEPLKKLREMP